MKKIWPVILLFLSSQSHAGECESSLTERLVDLVAEGLLTPESNTTDKHEKLTHHDYPVACTASHSNSEYVIFTDSAGKCLIIMKAEEKVDVYYGVFCS